MEEDNSGLQKLRKRLYKEGEIPGERLKREALPGEHKDFKTYWGSPTRTEEEDLVEIAQDVYRKKKRKSNIFLIFGLLFALLIAAGVFVYFFGNGLLGGNVVSSKNIDISIAGPALVNAGEPSKWVVTVTNNNNAKLQVADLIIEYPDGSFAISGSKLTSERRVLGEILPGATKQEELNLFVLGREEEQKEINVTVEYRVEDSNAIFAKSQKTVIEFSRSPVGITITLPQEIESGQQIKLLLDYVSNSGTVLKDMYVKVDYPAGFKFISSSIEPVEGKNLWKAGDLQPQEERKLEITGIIEGQDLTELTFQASVGPMNAQKELDVFAAAAGSTLLKKPFLNLNFLINGKDIESMYKEQNVTITVPWKNNLSDEIRNASINIKVSGRVVDLKTISVKNGFYRGYDNTIIWNASSMPALSVIAPGAEGVATFSFIFLDTFPVNSADDKNFVLSLEGEMDGFRSGQDGQSVEVKGSVKKEIKIASNIQVFPSMAFNSGALPPKVGKENIYTVTWSISNFYNDVSDVVVRSSIPSYVSWLGGFEPAGEDITYNPATGEVIWKIPKVEAGTGILKSLKQVKFRISFLPVLNQVGRVPMLVNTSTLEGKDSFAGLSMSDSKDPLITASISEAEANSLLGVVGQ